MSLKSGFQVSLIVIILILITACSGGREPVTGNLSGGGERLTTPNSTTGIANKMLWGYYNCSIDTASRTVEIVPARGLMMHVNAVEWMQPPGGSVSNLVIQIVDDSKWLTEGRFDIKVGLKHPFTGLNQFTGFDVMGVFLTDGNFTLKSQAGVTMSDGGIKDATMLNPDGYTRWWNQDEFEGGTIRIFSYIPGKLGVGNAACDARLNPYKYFADGLSENANECTWLGANASKRGLFSAGALNYRLYQLKWPIVGGVPQLRFDYAVVASWEAPSPNPPVNVPGDFPYSANALEPVALSVTDKSDLYYTGTTAGGDLDVFLEIYDWQYLNPGTKIPDTITKVTIESLSAHLPIPGGFKSFTPATWSVAAGGVNSSVWHVEIPNLSPTSKADADILVIFETKFNYDQGYGTPHPTGAPLSSYFRHTVKISPFIPGTDQPPYCNAPVPEYTSRTVIDLEEFTADVGDPEGETVSIDWSIVPSGNPPDWMNIDADTILVNWWNATSSGTKPGDYDVCVRVYNSDGEATCCTKVPVKGAPTLQPVTGQTAINLVPQPNQGALTCDITVANPGSGSVGEIMVQDIPGNVIRMYRFNDTYSAPIGISPLSNTGWPSQFANAVTFADYRKFDVTPSGAMLHVTSGNDTKPGFVDPSPPSGYNINDPKAAFILHYFNGTGGQAGYIALYGDVGTNGNPDPDAIPWKHFVDWSSGVTGLNNTRVYGFFCIDEGWLSAYPTLSHPGTVFAAWSSSPFNVPATLYATGLPGMSSQYPVLPGPINDTTPANMALGVDDAMPVLVDWDPGPGVQNSPLTVWWVISSEPTGTSRKVHIIGLPENFNIPYFFYDDYIGTGSPWGVDLGSGNTPVDVEVFYAAKPGTGQLDKNFNWVAVLTNSASGWGVRTYRYEPLFPTLVPVATYSGVAGTAHGMDIDPVEYEIHVLYRDTANQFRVTVLKFVP